MSRKNYFQTSDFRKAANLLRFGADLLDSKDRGIKFWQQRAREQLKEANKTRMELQRLRNAATQLLKESEFVGNCYETSIERMDMFELAVRQTGCKK